MKQYICSFSLFLLPLSSLAKLPPNPVVESCLAFSPASSRVTLDEFSGPEMISDDATRGYSTFAYKYEGERVGYSSSTKKSTDLIFLGNKSSPISKAKSIDGVRPEKLEPAKADFGIVRYSSNDYLCVSSNFDGIGRSGSFQNVRMAYILPIWKGLGKTPSELYFSVRDIRTFEWTTRGK
jgi:hypothetical protein